MKSLIKALNKRKHVLFIDLEGTQFSHEMIAVGAVRVDLDYKYRIRKIYPGFKLYVKSIGPIGRFVQELTGITPDTLKTEGVSFPVTMQKLKKYCGMSFQKMAFMTFGSHDLRIFAKSLEANPSADEVLVHHIMKNNIDLSALLSQYVKDENGNPYSLVNYLKLFDVTPTGASHDPLNDARDLMLLYKAAMKSNEKIYLEYLKVLKKMKHFPDPVRKAISKLVDGENVTSEEFKQDIRNYLE